MTGASAIGVPGWPEFAFWTASIESVRIVLTHSSSSVVSVAWVKSALSPGCREAHKLRDDAP